MIIRYLDPWGFICCRCILMWGAGATVWVWGIRLFRFLKMELSGSPGLGSGT